MLGRGITTAVKPQMGEGAGIFGKYLVPGVSGAEFRACEEECERNTAGRNQDADPGLQFGRCHKTLGEPRERNHPPIPQN